MGVGVIGAGRIATEAHIPAILDVSDAQLVGICTRDPARRSDLQQRYGCPWSGDVSSFILHPSIDLIVICAPAALHASLIQLCAAGGKHVLVEKPLATSVPDGLAAIAACRSAGVVLGVGYQRRLAPGYQKLQELLCQGALGQLVSAAVECAWRRAPDYFQDGRGTFALDGGGVLINQGIHSLDQLHGLLGPASAVVCETGRRWHTLEAEDSASGLLRLPGSLIATFSCTTAAAVSEAYRLVLVGTAAVATLTGGKLQIAAADHEATSGGPQDGGPPPTLQELVRLQLERMLAAISGRGSPACTGEAAIMSLASVRAAYQSAERGCWAMVDGGFGQGARRSGQH